MKKYIFSALCIINYINCMEQSLISHKIQRTPQEWNADLYAKGNKVQYESALHFLQHNKINLDHKHILDVGCGTGDISVFMATKAALVHGLDASKNMVEYSTEKYKHINNLSFEQSFAENFTSQNKTYDLATIFFCFHWLFDKRQALTQISQSLTAHGTLFGTFPTLDDQKLQRFIIAKQMLTELYPHHSLSEKLDRSESTLEELKIMLAETGFEIITCELQTNEVILPNREAFEDFQRPVAMSRPFIKEMSSEKAEAFFQEFITRVIPTMQQTEDGQLIEEMTTRIIHARKK